MPHLIAAGKRNVRRLNYEVVVDADAELAAPNMARRRVNPAVNWRNTLFWGVSQVRSAVFIMDYFSLTRCDSLKIREQEFATKRGSEQRVGILARTGANPNSYPARPR